MNPLVALFTLATIIALLVTGVLPTWLHWGLLLGFLWALAERFPIIGVLLLLPVAVALGGRGRGRRNRRLGKDNVVGIR